MKPLVAKLLIASTSFSLASAIGWFCVLPRLSPAWSTPTSCRLDPNEETDCGTQICARCGAKREVFLKGRDERRFVPGSTEEEVWATQRIGACKEHSWQETGCFFENGFNYTRFGAEHPVWRALVALADEQADEMATRFADVPAERQIYLWRQSQWHRGETPREVARSTATTACWSDLAAHWSD